MIFLGWNQPLLHATADWLLETANVTGTPDLSGVLVVLRGNRAGRRLLELLALKCAEKGIVLVPPEIVTPSNLVWRLTKSLPDEQPVAGGMASALAWAAALEELDPARREKLFRRPEGEKSPPSLRAFLGLGRHLGQVWSELGGADIAFQDVMRVLSERFPHVAEFEIPRWEAVESLHRKAGTILRRRGLVDRTDLLLRRARRAETIPGRRVILAGVAEMPKVVREFLDRLPEPPTALVFAPESERDGFIEPGILRPAHWEKRPAGLDAGQIHLVERDRDQAIHAAQIVRAWNEAGLDPGQMTIAVPRAEALFRLREALETARFQTRWAQGRPASDAPALQLLRRVADYLDHDPGEPPRFQAVAALVRHPDLPGLNRDAAATLDRFAAEHLPAHFDPASVSESTGDARGIQETLDWIVDIDGSEKNPVEIAEWTLRFLRRIYGGREENSGSPEGRIAVRGLLLLRDALDETRQERLPWPGVVRPADFLHVLLAFLGEETVPEPSASDAIQGVGWLELVEDDAPAVVVTSFVEGAVPESVSADPFLPGSLRQALSLADNAGRFARDAYALAAILGSRSGGRGEVALIAPRFDASENPTRPSRLLLAGLESAALARRVWHLAGRRPPEPQRPLVARGRFPAARFDDDFNLTKISATAFRDYLESPRKFFFLRVLRLGPESDTISELEGRDVGTLLHHVLASFGRDPSVRDSADEAVIRDYLAAAFDRLVAERFGRWVQPAVEIQLEEVRRRLGGFVPAQAGLRREGWTIRYVEGAGNLECDLEVPGAPGALRLTGKIDRIDHHPAENKWRILDYKTSAKAKEPLWEHRGRDGEWHDLQLPLYLKLAAAYARAEWNVELTPENSELTYFRFPETVENAGVARPFPAEFLGEAWAKAAETAAQILRGEFSLNPPLKPAWTDPALLALCGQVGIASAAPA